VPIKLVFETSNRLILDGCLPSQATTYDRSIVIVAPQKVVKVTAPDETRHALWLSALRYLVDSTRKVTADAWPELLAARLASLDTSQYNLASQRTRLESRVTASGSATASGAIPSISHQPGVQGDKPLPPSPPRMLQTASSAMTPPAVPRFYFEHPPPSQSESPPGPPPPLGKLRADSNDSSPRAGPAGVAGGSNGSEEKSFASGVAEGHTSSSDRQPPLSPTKRGPGHGGGGVGARLGSPIRDSGVGGLQSRSGTALDNRLSEETRGELGLRKSESRQHQEEGDELEVDQMDLLVGSLGKF
jgi:hypothetical protein